jgi:hypothetical protein
VGRELKSTKEREDSSDIFEEVKPNLCWITFLSLFLAVIFTIILNSYWPILLSVYRCLKDFLNKKRGCH